jgi:hypothetical protein
MSYEGYEQHICEHGHRFDVSCQYVPEQDGDEVTCDCEAKSVFYNEVDTTNCDEYGVIPNKVWDEKFLLSKEKAEVCNLGHTHIVEWATYRIPTKEELKSARDWWDVSDTGEGKYVVCGGA